MKKPRTKKHVLKPPKRPPADAASVAPADKENPFDFGGIPQRDLKKNLGCG